MEEVIDRLQMFGIKPSMQRIAIMGYLMKHYTHPTVDEIYTALSPQMPTLSKTTVYTTLKVFSDSGAAQMLTIDEKKTCYDADTSMHAHFLCHRCGKVYDLPMNTKSMKAYSREAPGYEVQEVHCYYKGVCPECLQAE